MELIEKIGAFGLSFWLPALGAAVFAYFCGCFNGAVIVSKYFLRDDVRLHGSGNAGLTNFYRTFGGPLTLVVIWTDVIKAVVAVLVGVRVFCYFMADEVLIVTMAKYWAGIFCMLGHMFPCMFRFKGGKGILSGGTLAILIDWRVALVVWGGFLLLTILTRWVSLGSCWAGASFPVVSTIVYPDVVICLLSLICGVLVLWKHWPNIKRLVRGEESKLSFHHKKEGTK